MKLNLNVYSLAEMTELLNTIRFWGSDVFPRALINFAARRKYAVIKSVLEPYRDDLQIICTACSLIGEVAGNELRLEKAMSTGNIDIVQYFHKKGTHFTTNAIALAAGKGALDCLQCAMNFQNVASYGHGIFLEAIRNGRMDSILFLQEKGFTLHLNCYYDNRNSTIKRVDLAEIAASSGQCDVLKYLHSQGCSLVHAANAAAEAGHWDCLEYAIQNGARLRGEYHSVGTLTLAQRLARARLLKLFPLALSRAGAIDERTTLNFAKMKKWELFQLCIPYITQTSLSLIFVAAEQGYIECLQRLYELSVSEVEASGNGLNWLTCAASHSTSSGLSLMDLALSAATANYWECLTFLITHGCPMPKSLTAVLAKAGQRACAVYSARTKQSGLKQMTK